MIKKFLVVVDTQYDFVMPDGLLYVPGAEEIIPAASAFLKNLDPAEYAGVLFTFDTHIPSVYAGSPESEMFPEHCVRYTKGWGNVLPLYNVPEGIPVFTLEKGVFNMWEEEHVKLNSKSFGAATDFTKGSSSEFTIDRDYMFEMMTVDKNLEAGIKADVIQVFGVASDFCVKWAVDGFVKRGFKVEVIDELCRGIGAPASDVFEGPDYIDVALV